ncbi:bifunctional folylpolyglutamate synthase/dihydrofolate synthase [Alkaliphilus hydrothermalis]|uniref:tetrahydrofolate synthase n=1 Tax=Alkaliphilus hydrothermalis TaxID=1482730 RepID=A0ABS2NPM2_9FIRM|nr:folylpolyglutamate synthase/dihydrofolate synthase family protein [Alkaliphilus hydrothermalis]MBM7614903.1 dihydrofolate synthase/folylpolyglutamate synthase [Alkaliphilus hydrothermalis]
MNFLEAIKFIEFCHSHGTRLTHWDMQLVLSNLGNPHQTLNFIHVAGTNGKGSTSSFIHSMLMAEGHQVGLFTSPHLHCYTDRLRINGINITKEEFAESMSLLQSHLEPLMGETIHYPAMFDMMTLLAFVYYSRKQVDYVVLEVGLGGLKDATNVIENSLVSVITPIGIDHVDVLGSDLEQIAYHKAGIIKAGGIVVSHCQEEIVEKVIRSVSQGQGAELRFLEKEDVSILHQDIRDQSFDLNYATGILSDLKIKMLGEHQIYNAALATLTLITLREHNKLQISNEAIYKGLLQNSWAGRLELLMDNPLTFIDGAHNHQGASVLSSAIKAYFKDKKINLVMGMLSNKDVSGVLEQLVPLGNKIIFTTPRNPKAKDPHELANMVKSYNKEILVAETIKDSIELALEITQPDEVIIFTGSLYLIGDVRKNLVVTEEDNEYKQLA